MSAAGRLGGRVRHDDYPSPTWPFLRLLERVKLPGGKWVEPSAGSGSVIRMLREHPIVAPTIEEIHAVELDREGHPELATLADRVLYGDFLKLKLEPVYDVCIGNPPYEDAFPFVEEGLRIARWVVYLLRANFLGSGERQPFFAQAMPDVLHIPERPTFVIKVRIVKSKLVKTTSDSCDYAMFVWRRELLPRRDGVVTVLDQTPAEVRRAARLRAPIVVEDRDGSWRRYLGPPEELGLAFDEIEDVSRPPQLTLF